jgi:hypothetical protein
LSRKSANILVLGWLLILLGTIGFALTYSIKTNVADNLTAYRSGDCPLADSYFKDSDLTNAEKKQFSSNAKAFELIGQSSQRYRLIFDYRIDTQSRQKIEIRSFVSSEDKLHNLSIKYLLNGVDSSGDKRIESDQNFAYLSSNLEINSPVNFLGISISVDGTCEFSQSELIKLDIEQDYGNSVKNWASGNSALSNFKGNEITLLPGDNYLSFDDWGYIANLLAKGIEVLSFSPTENKWIKMDKNIPVVQPGKVYLIKNASKDRLTLAAPKPYRVPDDLTSLSLQKGWNLVAFNNANQKLSEIEVSVNED